MFILTRPLPKLAASQQAFEGAGVPCVGVATTDIQIPSDVSTRIHSAFSQHSTIDAVIVTSVYAVSPLLTSSIDLNTIQIIAIGTATAQALQQALPEHNILTPLCHTSEGILSMHQFDGTTSKQVVIMKGEGGRHLLATTLNARGYSAIECNVYQRLDLPTPVFTNKWKIGDVSGIIATSEHLAKQLLRAESTLANLPWLTVSQRVSDALRMQGINSVAVCNGATDNALIAWIKDNWEY